MILSIFQLADVNQRLPFDDETFDAVMCIDSMNHFRDRLSYLRQWQRLVKSGERAVFTDPVVITGPVSNEKLAARSNKGKERFDGLQKFFSTVHKLTSERRLSRFVFLTEKP